MIASRFKTRLKWRIVTLFSVLICLLFTIALLVVNKQNISNAESNISSDLNITTDLFDQLIALRSESLKGAVKPATSDHAFRQVYSAGHIPTLTSAMRNILSRLDNATGAQMLLVDFDNVVFASTDTQHKAGDPFRWSELILKAEENDFLEAIELIHTRDGLHKVIITPLLIPDPEAWIILSFPVDDRFVTGISEIAQIDLSLYAQTEPGAGYTLAASSLGPKLKPYFTGRTDRVFFQKRQKQTTLDSGARYLSLLNPMTGAKDAEILLAVHGSLDDALIPYQKLNTALYWIFGVGLLLTLVGTLSISNSITKPIQDLTESVKTIGEGDFAVRANQTREDEIGILADSVNKMAVGLAEKEKVRSLLGKVVSQEIADELLTRDIELAGEEREVSILFADIRNFTSISEKLSPSDLLHLLNRYFTTITEVIENNHGVVDKYIGDEVMAIFGAPISNHQHAQLAVKSAKEILTELTKLNVSIAQDFAIRLEIGIGINSGNAVAGNVGSHSRMNYTLLGDTVNTAARLQTLTKDLGHPVAVSKSTATDAPDNKWLDQGEISIRGKEVMIHVYCLDS